jgi:hypothetical protein
MRWFIFAHKADGRNLLVGYLRQREDDGLWPLSRQIVIDLYSRVIPRFMFATQLVSVLCVYCFS